MLRFIVRTAVLALSAAALPQHAAAQDGDPYRDLFVTANVQFTLCHELTHALIAAFEIPVLGREEDAADQISTLCFLHPAEKHRRDPQAVEKLLAVADAWRLEWELDKRSGGTAYWDEHALDIQRYYNVLCALYGSDPQTFAQLPDRLELPWQRAWSCADYEYDRLVGAGRWLMETYAQREDRSADVGRGQVKVVYDDPGESKRLAYATLKASALFESKAKLMNELFDLPDDIAIVGTDCLGDATAYWNQNRREVVFCYDLVDRFIRLAALHRCVSGSAVSLAERRPVEPARMRHCLAEAQ